ncbi:translation factor [Anaeramoeba flamelloides]|uniref:Translation factor n=1 Tax=Anaeramoeba flamelloides TaxID=1746091 RepID=A0ABQ8XH86_9EUKA|nr:translation factor [Anaeramoeba flamelloides]
MTSKPKPNLGVIFLGHVDCGKSTIIGHLGFLTGSVTKKQMDKCEKESREGGKESFKYAWVVDKTRHERSRGLTTISSVLNLELTTKSVTTVNVPGLANFLPKLMERVFHTEVAVLVVSAAEGEFESGISTNGQTKDHLRIASSFGVEQIVVVVNKMDDRNVKYSFKRYREVKTKTMRLLESNGYCANDVPFIPISGWCGDNLTENSTKMGWYTGETLLSTIESMHVPFKYADLPLRIPILNVFNISGLGTVPIGRIEFGKLEVNQVVKFGPTNTSGQVLSIQSFGKSKLVAYPGDEIGFHVKDATKKEIKKGMVAGDLENDPPSRVSSFQAKITLLNASPSLTINSKPRLFVHTLSCICNVDTMLQLLNPESADEILKKKPSVLNGGDTAIVVLKPQAPICVEPFDRYPKLGRFMLMMSKKLIGYGIIKSVTKAEN